MSKLLSELVDQLQEDVPAREGIPSEDQYERAVKEAVRDFSRRCGRKRRVTLNVVSGTATYDLADDFLKLIKFMSLTAHDGIINSPAGLIPVPADFCEEWTINEGQITFYPTPAYTLTREYTYKAAWVATPDDYGEVYEKMGDEEADIILKKAKASSLELLWKQNAGTSFKYQIGDESYDMSNVGNDFEKSMKAAEGEYLRDCDSYNGNTSRML